ncbi:hypothetical protein EYF80_016678 [Liparis tanakae]|uniref:Uncharacterized protein n=1 Tax=Liparis tanakae TaxID=230148 RepID=A0A4Z2I7D8_9TELE|nr:hypothetical protein EYF80_016678 [Liparis tanakae]
MPMASAITTWPKQPSPRGFPRVSLKHKQRNSHLGSEGSSSSETLASMGPSLDDRRAIRTSGVLEFMEELESKDTCLGAEQQRNCYRLRRRTR